MKKKKGLQPDNGYMAFMRDVAAAMERHSVTDMVCISGFKGQIRNTYLPMGGGEDRIYCQISDAMNAWLSQASVKGITHG